jgi:hypothetical protein
MIFMRAGAHAGHERLFRKQVPGVGGVEEEMVIMCVEAYQAHEAQFGWRPGVSVVDSRQFQEERCDTHDRF